MGNKQALVIGINAYDPRNALPSCVADADAFADVLGKAYGFTRIANLRDQQASHDAMAAALTQLIDGATAGDQLVFYYSGHGYSFPKNGVTIEALVPQDEIFFDCDQLAEITNAVPPGVMTVVLDACYSGGMEKAFVHPDGLVEVHRIKSWQPPDSQKGFVAAPRGGTRYKAFSNVAPTPGADRRFLLLSACLPYQTAAASTSKTNGRSAFTFAFLERLAVNALATGSVENLLRATGEELDTLGIQQTPTLKAPAQLDQQPFLDETSAQPISSATSTAKSSGPTNHRSIVMDQNTSLSAAQPYATSAEQKGWADFALHLANAVVPIAFDHIRKPMGKGLEGPDTVTIDSKGFMNVLSSVLTTALPIVAQSLVAQQVPAAQANGAQPQGAQPNGTQPNGAPPQSAQPQGAQPQGAQPQGAQPQGAQSQGAQADADKGFFDSVSHAVSSVLSSPLAQTALQVGTQIAIGRIRPRA